MYFCRNDIKYFQYYLRFYIIPHILSIEKEPLMVDENLTSEALFILISFFKMMNYSRIESTKIAITIGFGNLTFDGNALSQAAFG